MKPLDTTYYYRMRRLASSIAYGCAAASALAPAYVFGAIVGAAGTGGAGGASNGGRGGDGGGGHEAFNLTGSYTTVDDVEGGPGGGGGGGGGGGFNGFVGGGGGAGGVGGNGIVISGDNVTLTNNGWAISGGKGGGGGGGGGGTYSPATVNNGGKGGNGAGGLGGGAGGGGGGGADINPYGPDGSGYGGDGGDGGANGSAGGGNPTPSPLNPYAGGGGGGGGSTTAGGTGGWGAYKETGPGTGAPGGLAGANTNTNGGNAQGFGFGGGGGGGGAPGGAGGSGGPGTGFPGGPPGGAGGASGYGILVEGKGVRIINSGRISPGPVNQYVAIKYSSTAANSTLVLRDGSNITGVVDAQESAGTNVLALDGGSATAFNVKKVGGIDLDSYLGFNKFEKSGEGTWSLTGTPSQARTDWLLSGGYLRVTQDESLGNSQSRLSFAEGGLITDGTFEVKRASEIVSNGRILVTDGNTATILGGIGGVGRLIKEGDGNLVLATDNTFSGGTKVDGGTLTVGNGATAGTLGTGDVVNNAQLIFSRSDNYSLPNNIEGSGDVTFTGGGTATATGNLIHAGLTRLDNGNLTIDGGRLGASVLQPAKVIGSNANTLSLSNGGLLTGSVWGANAIIGNSSVWVVPRTSESELSSTGQLDIGGEIRISPAIGSTVGRNVAADRVVGLGGSIELSAILAPDGKSDYLHARGGATGMTNILVNPVVGLPGDPLPSEGLMVVKSEGDTSNAFTFGGFVGNANGKTFGPYTYGLLKGDKVRGQSGEWKSTHSNDWYLRAALRPEVSLYTQMAGQGLRLGEEFIGTFNERIGDQDSLKKSPYRYSWVRPIGSYNEIDGEDGGVLNNAVGSKTKTYGLQIGSDVYVWMKGLQRSSIGLYGVWGQSGSTVDHYYELEDEVRKAGKSTQTAAGLGSYYTYLGEKGTYLDVVAQLTRVQVKVKSSGTGGSLRTNGWAGAVSAEVGRAFVFSQQSKDSMWVIEPQAQAIYQRVSYDDAQDSVSKVSFPDVDKLTGRVGFRVSKKWDATSPKQRVGWASLSLVGAVGGESKATFPTATKGGVSFKDETDGVGVRMKLGYDQALMSGGRIYVETGATQSLSGREQRKYDITAGVKYVF